MSQVLSYFRTKEDIASQEPIATSRGPENTCIITYSNNIAIHPSLPTNEAALTAPAHVYSLDAALKRLYKRQKTSSQSTSNNNLTQLSQIKAFTSETLYDYATEQFIVVTDSSHILTFPSRQGASLFDGSHWQVFGSQFSQENRTFVHSIMLHPTLPRHVLIVDNWGRLHNYPIPLNTAEEFSLDKKSNTPPTILKKMKHASIQCPPIIHWAGLITAEHCVVATQYGMVCYNINTTSVVDEIDFIHANFDVSSHSIPSNSTTKQNQHQTVVRVAKNNPSNINTGNQSFQPVAISNVSSFRKDTDRPPRFFATSIPQAVLYTDGHLEIYNFNLATTKFVLVYARALAQPYTLPWSIVQVITPQHLAILTPSNPAITDPTQHDTRYFILDLTYYTISAYLILKKSILPPQLCTSNHNSSRIAAKPYHAFQLDLSNQRTVVSATYIINKQIHVFVSQPTLPTLALSIGCATRDASFWASISRVNSKSPLRGTDAHVETRDGIHAAGNKTPTKVHVQFLDTQGAYISLLNPRCAAPVASTNTSSLHSEQHTTTPTHPSETDADVKDVILTLSSQTLPMLNPFSTKPPLQSLSNRIDHVKLPSTLLMQTATNATASLDAVILENWSTYLTQCDSVERISLMKMLPRLVPYLSTSSPADLSDAEYRSRVTSTPLKRKLDQSRASQKTPTSSQQFELVNNSITTTELSADIFLYEFFAYCATYIPGIPSVTSITSLPLPQNMMIQYQGSRHDGQQSPLSYSLSQSVQSHQKCSCKVNTIQPPLTISQQTTSSNLKRSDKNNHQLNDMTHLQTFVTQLAFEPCAWKALLGSTISLTNTKTSYHTLKSILFHNTNLLTSISTAGAIASNQVTGALLQQVSSIGISNNSPAIDWPGSGHGINVNNDVNYSALLYRTATHPIQPFCSRSNKIMITKPLSPLFNHLLFRECLRKIDRICCNNCPNILYLIPLEILIANCMMNSSLAITCIKVGLKHKLWSLISSIVTASNISHSESFTDIIVTILDDLSDRFDGNVDSLYIIGAVSDSDNEVSPVSHHTIARNKTKALSISETSTLQHSRGTVDSITTHTAGHTYMIQSKSSQSVTTVGSGTNLRQLHDLNGFCTKVHCTCNPSATPPLFGTRPAPSNFTTQYPHISQFVAATIPQQSASCVLFTLLVSPITPDILIQQLRTLSLDYVLLLLNILSLLFQATLGQIPLPNWLSPCGDCHQYLTPESLLKWISMLIDSHGKELMIAQHLLHVSQYNALNVFASLHSLIHAYCAGNAEMLENVLGITDQLSILRELGLKKVNVTEPYTISLVKF